MLTCPHYLQNLVSIYNGSVLLDALLDEAFFVGLKCCCFGFSLSMVRVAGPQKGKRGQMRSEEAELALTTAFLRRSLSLVGVRAQARLLLGRLEVIGPGAAAAAGRRNHALQQAFIRRGHFKTN